MTQVPLASIGGVKIEIGEGMGMRLFAGTPWDRPPRCQRCNELEEDCKCPPAVSVPADPENQTVRLSTEKRKKGKFVTIVQGLSSQENDLSELLTQLKTSCGAGGTLKEDRLEIQGKHLDSIRGVLKGIGYRVKG